MGKRCRLHSCRRMLHAFAERFGLVVDVPQDLFLQKQNVKVLRRNPENMDKINCYYKKKKKKKNLETL